MTWRATQPPSRVSVPKRLETSLLAVVVALLIVGAAVIVAGQPWLTARLSARHSQGEAAGLSAQRTAELAETVRAYVVDGAGSLPERIDEGPGFDAASVSHLDDVRDVLGLARVVTFVAAGLLAVWVVSSVRRKSLGRLAAGLRLGAAIPVLVIALATVVALVDFSAFFEAFHALFFSAGTWTFSYDSLLIRLFPQGFWIAIGVWAAGLVTGFSAIAWAVSVRADGAARRSGT